MAEEFVEETIVISEKSNEGDLLPKVGSDVFYVPSEDHKYEKDPEGLFVFRFADKKGKELSKKQVKDFLRRDIFNLVPLGPQYLWPAKITKLHDDGSADLTIKVPGGFCTLEYVRVPFDPSKTQWGSWHN